MKKNLISLALLLFSSAVKGFNPYRKASMELAHLKMSLFYIKGIKGARLAVLGLFGIGACLVFLASGLILFHATLFLYAPWSNQVKMVVGLSCAGLYVLITAFALYYFLSQEKWLKAFRADHIISNLEKELSSESSSSDVSSGYKNGNGNKQRETAGPYKR